MAAAEQRVAGGRACERAQQVTAEIPVRGPAGELVDHDGFGGESGIAFEEAAREVGLAGAADSLD
jgi:hypothetical protein